MKNTLRENLGWMLGGAAMGIGLVALVFLLSGCGSHAQIARVEGPPAYKEGFNDGCASGYSAAGHMAYKQRKDVGRALSDKPYGMGWEDGFRRCKAQHESVRGIFNSGYRY